jgi:hypothetical protein
MIAPIYPSVLQAVSGAGLCRVPGWGVFRGTGVRLYRILDMNFYEKALFVKVDLAAAMWLTQLLLFALRALCFHSL